MQEPSSLDIRVGHWLRQRRTERKLTQATVSNRMRDMGYAIDPTGITRIEKGFRTLKIDEAHALSAVLDVPFAHLAAVIDGGSGPEAEAKQLLGRAKVLEEQISKYVLARWDFADKLQGLDLSAEERSLVIFALGRASEVREVALRAYFLAAGWDWNEGEGQEGVPEAAIAKITEREERRKLLINSLDDGEGYSYLGFDAQPDTIDWHHSHGEHQETP